MVQQYCIKGFNKTRSSTKMISTLIVRYKSTFDSAESHDLWHNSINKASENSEGFLDRTELPSLNEEAFSSVVLRFDTSENAKKWLKSGNRIELIESELIHLSEKEEMIYDGDTSWFRIDAGKTPGKWKQWVVAFLSVYPLTLVVPLAVGYIFEKFSIVSWLAESIIIGFIITGAMVYKIMPFMLRVFKTWMVEKT